MPKPVEKISGKKLAQIRVQMLMNQQDWARELGWSIGNLKRIEGGEAVGVDLATFRDLATFLKRTPEELRAMIGLPEATNVATEEKPTNGHAPALTLTIPLPEVERRAAEARARGESEVAFTLPRGKPVSKLAAKKKGKE